MLKIIFVWLGWGRHPQLAALLSSKNRVPSKSSESRVPAHQGHEVAFTFKNYPVRTGSRWGNQWEANMKNSLSVNLHCILWQPETERSVKSVPERAHPRTFVHIGVCACCSTDMRSELARIHLRSFHIVDVCRPRSSEGGNHNSDVNFETRVWFNLHDVHTSFS